MPKILKTKKQPQKQKKSLLYLFSVFKGLLLTVIGFLLISFLIYKVNDTSFYYYLIFGFIALGSFIAGFISYKKLGGRGIVCGLFSAILIMFLIITITLISINFDVSPRILLIIPVCILSGVVGGIVSANK